MLFKTARQGQSGLAGMPESHSSNCSHPRGQEIDFGTKDNNVYFACCNDQARKERHWLSPSYMLKYQTVLMEQGDVVS